MYLSARIEGPTYNVDLCSQPIYALLCPALNISDSRSNETDVLQVLSALVLGKMGKSKLKPKIFQELRRLNAKVTQVTKILEDSLQVTKFRMCGMELLQLTIVVG